MIDLLLACAPAVHPVTMAAVVKQESGGHPWVISSNTQKRSFRFASKEEAVVKATELISAGENIDIGLAQINSKNLSKLGLSIEQAFEPCTNVAAGAKILEVGYSATRDLKKALAMYNTGKADTARGAAYARSVYAHAGVSVPAIPGGQIADLPPLTPQEPRRQPSAPAFSPRWY